MEVNAILAFARSIDEYSLKIVTVEIGLSKYARKSRRFSAGMSFSEKTQPCQRKNHEGRC
jgi:hypothetical protein